MLEGQLMKLRRKLKKILPTRFSLIFDGWSHGDTHYVGVFATFPTSTMIGYTKILLGISPMGNEESQSADAYIEYFEFILDSFEKTWSNVSALIGDNFATNKAVAKKVKCSFIGRASHRFNLAVQGYLKVYSDNLNQIHHIC